MVRIAVVVAAALAGCASNMQWNKPGITQASLDQDLAQCRYEAASSTSGYGTSETRRGASRAAGQGIGEGLAQADRERDLIMLCLKARGYQLEARR